VFLYYGIIFGLILGVGGLLGSRILLSVTAGIIFSLFAVGNLIDNLYPACPLPLGIVILLISFVTSTYLCFKISRVLGKYLIPGIIGSFVGVIWGVFGMITFFGLFAILGHKISTNIKTVEKISFSLKSLKYFLIGVVLLIIVCILPLLVTGPFELNKGTASYIIMTIIWITLPKIWKT